MYTAHFGLQEPPFAITPDPGYLYLSEYHREALAHLVYGIGENGGFVQLTGEVGTGKTTLIRALLAQQMAAVHIALCLNPHLSVIEFVALIMDELGIAYPPGCQSLKQLVDLLNEHLLAVHARGGRTVVIIDEAQNLGRDVLEQIRLLTNLETSQHKLLRIILVGQPELRVMLARRDLRQLAQRITARYHLLALNREETAAYIRHRLQVAGAKEALFTKRAIAAVYRSAQGIPRLINVVCDRALLGAYADNRALVDTRRVKTAAAEVFSGGQAQPLRRRFYHPLPGPARAAVLLGAVFFLLPQNYIIGSVSFEPADVAYNAVAERADQPIAFEPFASEPPAPAALQPDRGLGGLSGLSAFLAAPASADGELKRLLSLWQVTLDSMTLDSISDEGVCAQLENRNFRCLSDEGDWATLRHYNRPAIIALIDDRGGRQEVVLESLSDDKAVLVNAEDRIAVGLAELDPLWTGEFFLIWQTPPYAELIGPGSSGEKVVWLRRQLAQLEKRQPEEPLSAVFDSSLLEQVKRFQRKHRLAVDGLVGTQTLQLLHKLAPAPSTPLLVRASEETKESG